MAVMKNCNIWIEIDLQKIRDNLACVQTVVGEDVAIMAVVKANAYGHGMLRLAHELSESVSYFAVSAFSEANALRNDGILTPILILGTVVPDEMEAAVEKDCTFTISDYEYLKRLQGIATGLGKEVKVHFKIDTGMGRWGLPYCEAFQIIRQAASLPHVVAEGLFTHFSVADVCRSDYTDRQIELFKAMRDELANVGIVFPLVHAANSAGLVHFQEAHFNLVRPGIALYGYCPRPAMQKRCSVTPVLSLKSRIALIKRIASQRGISYGRKFVTPSETVIGVVPVGYSHGYPYALSHKAEVLIAGVRYPIVGSVCMDYCMVDLGAGANVVVGDEVVLLGQSGNEAITAYDLANAAGTIPYEILTNLNADIPRVYVHEA